MKIYWPMFWSQHRGIDYGTATLRLDDILPGVGKSTFAFFDINDLPADGETIDLVWTPPVSDLNGWSEQPSEIAQSYLLQAKVLGATQPTAPTTEASRRIHCGKREYALDVVSCERFLAVLQALAPHANPWHLLSNAWAWERISWCGSAVVEGLTYLTATSNEAYMELIVEEAGEQIIGLFSLHMDPGGACEEFGKKILMGEERRLIRQALDSAQALHDSQPAYLVETVLMSADRSNHSE
ncbi:hypothetical protein JFT91_13585 [Pseudomonas sp. TH08]|uniref:hypothetical protein n=1 Tax=unclassified Pseudomonas TaxID=196821 RepID=UPI0019126231|nr:MULTISPECIES: hypothetical protein [unclassified Pseudomonas]MBK5529182.1 hypothetical protein [Pseudomonas sp. TH06]MBK5533615.1 hypothetical protein [Pseudomonas sp. TH08]